MLVRPDVAYLGTDAQCAIIEADGSQRMANNQSKILALPAMQAAMLCTGSAHVHAPLVGFLLSAQLHRTFDDIMDTFAGTCDETFAYLRTLDIYSDAKLGDLGNTIAIAGYSPAVAPHGRACLLAEAVRRPEVAGTVYAAPPPGTGIRAR